MAPSRLDKQTAGCSPSHNWLMGLAIDLAALCGIWRKNGTNSGHLTVFSLDIAFACHFIATHLPSTLSPYRSASGIGYASKKLSKMAGS